MVWWVTRLQSVLEYAQNCRAVVRARYATAMGHWKPRHGLMLAAIAILGTAIIVIVYITLADAEVSEAKTTFSATLGLEVERFSDFFRTRLLGMRAVADSLRAQPGNATRSTVDMVRLKHGN
jgi:hypothetical protein